MVVEKVLQVEVVQLMESEAVVVMMWKRWR